MVAIAGQPQEKVKPVLVIGLTEDGKIAVSGNLKEKTKLLNVIAEAIKVIANFKPSPIITSKTMPQKGGIMGFVRKRRR